MGIVDLLQSLFGQKEAQSQTISQDELANWFHAKSKKTQKKLQQSFSEYKKSLQPQIDDLSEINAKLTQQQFANMSEQIKTLANGQKDMLVSELEPLVASYTQIPSDSIADFMNFFEQAKKQLDIIDAVQKQTADAMAKYLPQYHQKLSITLSSIRKIFEEVQLKITQEEFVSYFAILAKLQELEAKQKKAIEIDSILNKYEQKTIQVQIEKKQLQTKVNSILNDPRYQIEKDVVRKEFSRYHHSFYELELEEFQSKLSHVQKKLDLLSSASADAKKTKEELAIPTLIEDIVLLIEQSMSIQLTIEQAQPKAVLQTEEQNTGADLTADKDSESEQETADKSKKNTEQ